MKIAAVPPRLGAQRLRLRRLFRCTFPLEINLGSELRGLSLANVGHTQQELPLAWRYRPREIGRRRVGLGDRERPLVSSTPAAERLIKRLSRPEQTDINRRSL